MGEKSTEGAPRSGGVPTPAGAGAVAVGLTSRDAGPGASRPHVELQGIGKRYSGARALDDVSLSIDHGEIHALVGENGAGKSTLGRIVAGAVARDAGTMHVDGRPVSYGSPREAIRDGIAIVDQELALVPTLSVLDNVFLGVEHGARGLLDRSSQRARFAELAERIGLTVNGGTLVGTLSTADQQKIEILRALARNATLIVMDEPTAALTREETRRLLGIIGDLCRDGVTIVYVSHFLVDVLTISHRVTVLKDGRFVKTAPAPDETPDSLVSAMLGRSLDVAFPPARPAAADAPVVLSVRGLTRLPAFRDVDLTIRAGEIVGMAGLVGSGRTEIARAIFGADPCTGDVEIDGRPVPPRSPRAAIAAGMAMLPESRKDQGLVMLRSVSENVSMAHLDALTSGGVLRIGHERRLVADVLKKVDVRAASPSLAVSSLSGGNQQKVALAKWLVGKPRLLIADEPTRGVDVGAKAAIYELLVDLAAGGVAILVISSELEEVLGLAHRTVVVRTGRIVAEFTREDARDEDIMRAAFSGARPSELLNGGSIR